MQNQLQMGIVNEATEVEVIIHKSQEKMWVVGRMSPNKHFAGNFQIIYSTCKSGDGGASKMAWEIKALELSKLNGLISIPRTT